MPTYDLGLEHVSLAFATKTIFTDVTQGVFEGNRIGIVGRNGDGKSTLLHLFNGTQEPDSGRVTRRGGLTFGMLDQRDPLDDEATVRQAALEGRADYEWASDNTSREIVEALLGGISLEAKIGSLSGGQRRRADLARLLLRDWDILALDEPTNHLDVVTIHWLAEHLKRRWAKGSGALLLVTHDRWFLDEVCESMWEVHDGVIEPFEGGYSAYMLQRVERDRQAAVIEDRRQNLLRKELAWLSRGAQARSSKPKFRIDAARAMIADVPPMRNPLELKRLAVSRLGKQVFELKQATVTYGDKTVIDHVDWLVGPGDRYGILGENGAGKTTLLRLLDGKLAPTSGMAKMGKSVKLGILSQHIDLLSDKLDWRVRELLGTYKKSYQIAGKDYTPQKLLESLGFDKRELDTPIRDLSGGQARRLALMCVLLDEPNVLILDEPGKVLDTDMLAVMEDLLDTWPGTLLLVTHDRYLMERVTDDQFALIGGRLTHVPGGVDEYLGLIGERHGSGDVSGHGPAPKAPVSSTKAETSNASPAQASGLSSSEEWKLRKQLTSLEGKMDTQRGRVEELERAMGEVDQTDYVALEGAQAKVDEAKARLDELEGEWLEIGERLEG